MNKTGKLNSLRTRTRLGITTHTHKKPLVATDNITVVLYNTIHNTNYAFQSPALCFGKHITKHTHFRRSCSPRQQTSLPFVNFTMATRHIVLLHRAVEKPPHSRIYLLISAIQEHSIQRAYSKFTPRANFHTVGVCFALLTHSARHTNTHTYAHTIHYLTDCRSRHEWRFSMTIGWAIPMLRSKCTHSTGLFEYKIMHWNFEFLAKCDTKNTHKM